MTLIVIPKLFPIDTFSKTREPNDITLKSLRGLSIGKATANISRGCFFKKVALFLALASPTTKSRANASHDAHWMNPRMWLVESLGFTSNAGQENATKKANARKVRVTFHNFFKFFT